MADAKRDDNQITTLLAVSNVDGSTPVPLYAGPPTHRLLVSATSSNSVAGSDTQVQFNDSDSFGGDSGFTYNKTTDRVTLAGGITLTSGTGLTVGLSVPF